MIRSLPSRTRAALLALAATPLLFLAGQASAANLWLTSPGDAAFEALERAQLEEELVRAERTAVLLTEFEHGLAELVAEEALEDSE